MAKKTKTLRQQVLAALIVARKYLKRGWTQNWFAKDAEGDRVSSDDVRAVCWCVTGALDQALPTGGDAWSGAITALERTVRTDNIVEWNDESGRTQGEVVECVTKTINRLRKQEAARGAS